MDIWSRVRALQGQIVRTVEGVAVRIDLVTDNAVTITLSTGSSRDVDRERIERASVLKKLGEPLRPSVIKKAGIARQNHPYIAAIVNAVS